MGRLVVCVAALVLSTAALQGAAKDPRLVINAGRSGDTTQDLLARLEADVLSHSPDLVVLLAGTNDRLNSRKALSLGTYTENLGALVRGIVSNGSRLLMVTVPPATESYLIKRHGAKFFENEDPRQRIIAVNSAIHRVARENQITVVDFFASVERAGGASERPDSLICNVANSGREDGVHPTAKGYRLLGALVADAMERENLQGVRRIVCFGDSLTRGVHMSGEGTSTGDTYPAFLSSELEDRFPPVGAPRFPSEATGLLCIPTVSKHQLRVGAGLSRDPIAPLQASWQPCPKFGALHFVGRPLADAPRLNDCAPDHVVRCGSSGRRGPARSRALRIRP